MWLFDAILWFIFWILALLGLREHDYARDPPHKFTWSEARVRATRLVDQMSMDEKLNITSGRTGPCQANSGSVERLGIPSFCYNDGPAGLRHTDFTTQYPSQFTMACSFDRELVRELTERMSAEFAGKGVNVQLGPLTGGPLGRSPYCGRNWEAFSPDPYLSSTLSYVSIRAAQSSGLVACAKHYFMYEQAPVCSGPPDDEGVPTDCTQVSVTADDKTVKELYLPSFAEAVRAGVGAIMCSYNQINGTPACQSDDAMNRILKKELNFQGYVLSDFGATHSTAESANAGMDQELEGTWWYGDNLKHAVKDGKVPEERLNDMVTRILIPWIAFGQKDKWHAPSYTRWGLGDWVWFGDHLFENKHDDVRKADYADFVRQAAEQSHVLLKNDGVLPLNPGIRRIAVFGTDADYPTTIAGCGADLFCTEGEPSRRHWNGTVTIGGGSGAVYATYIVPPIEAISRRGRERGMRVDHVLRDDPAYYPAIGNVANTVQMCIVFVSVFLVEGADRVNLGLDNDGEKLIKHVADKCAGDVVVAIHAGGPVIMEDWIEHEKVKGVVWAGYPGQESGNAIANILFGDVNPSGKMAFTLGRREADWPPNNIVRKMPMIGKPRTAFDEKLAIDYKWFDTQGHMPRYEFGYGLSYTTFELSDLRVRPEHRKDTAIHKTAEAHLGPLELYDTMYVVRVDVRNTGDRSGGEVPQLYMSYPPSQRQPPRNLRGYDKVWLRSGQRVTVEFPLRKKDIAVWDVVQQAWRVPEGTFTLYAGHSSRELVLETTLEVQLE
ncbi:hypothetical protein CcaverHIS002_0200660 [Cutaneotrichosporon cavernicola]|uniref:Probable beta-glucosidase G n=1 Tax=Cutaneotrichosporon cavernicola TaxID=279322 RepID=A0AA48I339_9TREE|nr:uncharacterized protein CcaverHIS019_0200710 [Cutaneotrichosporon cavernicola]BEI80906.1 hypothetical protein CcaverHIS002_0200660 [Cutaneotrichosporon cavernicola]BEI88709.1 hypothetical protein CcaverHIS019_0200710 [Cutaneotrichosporon cavernicola]BEI96483.1 hypothetical protein CcaverHIS631_0200720 [Cutaneotrichosporon cavernicola]BEJ04254.1 hypothetical protein CcaverHIS641_0200710 [Cutaneotrichosporon cavernicola]